jgi:TRAP-type transport system small permease protein
LDQKKSWIDIALGAAASILLLGMMLLTFADVVGRYLFNWPLRGAFEITELSLLVLIFAGLPLVSRANEHVTMDFIDRWLPEKIAVLVQRVVQLFCGAIILGLAWQVFIKAGKISGYGDTTDVLKIAVGPFVYFMTLMIAITGVIHIINAFGPIKLALDSGFDPDKVGTT